MVQNVVDICSVAVSLLSFVLIYYIFIKIHLLKSLPI